MLKKLIVGLIMVAVMAGGAMAEERCFTFTGNVRDRAPSPDIVASMGDGWIHNTNFYQLGVVEGQAVSYRICVDGDSARLDSSSLYPVGGESHPDGYTKPQGAYNMIYYNDPGMGDSILLGDDNEYVHVVHDGMPFDQWAIGKSLIVSHSHHSLYGMPLTYNNVTHYDWVSRIYIDGWISDLDPLTDSDGDGFPDVVDNCPDDPNDLQLDSDGDGIGDDCDEFPDCADPNGDCGLSLPECWVDVNPMESDEACWEIYTQADFRYYHESSPYSNQLHNPGGYKIAVSFWNMTTPPYDVVEIRSDRGHRVTFPPFPVYKFLGNDLIEYIMWFGHGQNAIGAWSVYLEGELLRDNIYIPIGVPKAPVVTVTKMKKKDNGIELEFHSPLVDGFQRINLRIFDELAEDFEEEIRFYDISKHIKTEIPLEFSGRQARFEYRVQGGVRTLLYITLP